MNILFLTIGRFDSINKHGIYYDLLRCFHRDGHCVYVVCSREKRQNLKTELFSEENTHILNVCIGNITKTKMIEKCISTIKINGQYLTAMDHYFAGVKFDLILYATPPVTFAKVVAHIKKRDNAETFLMLKDIFPQNAVDLGLMQTTGLYALLYKYFRHKEIELYAASDRIGCMSQANVAYLLKHNPEINAKKVEVCPNSIDVQEFHISTEEKLQLRMKYKLPFNKTVFVYGGNLGKPQGVPFIIQCLDAIKDRQDVFFLIVGDGTEFYKLQTYVEEYKPENVKLIKRIPQDEYDRMLCSCDVGLIFLDHRFTIPNFPSRLLTYMQARLPVLACTDANTDIGKTIVEGGFGWWCESSSVGEFILAIDNACCTDLRALGDMAYYYLKKHYSVEKCYKLIAEN